MVLLNVQGDPKEVMNPAFSRYHPSKNVVYTCTEDIEENGKIFAYKLGSQGELEPLGEAIDAGGTSTCYLTIDKAQKNLLAVNYWDSTLVTIPLEKETGAFAGPIKSKYDPKKGKQMVAAAKKNGGVNHSHNDESTIKARQADPHSHALVLDPYVGAVAYVPDLGKDLIREFYYDRTNGSIEMEMNFMPSGLCTGKPDGPRYIHFHPKYNIAYVVNELSSTIAVFEVDKQLLKEISEASKRGDNMDKYKGRSTLRLIQSIATIPSAFPGQMVRNSHCASLLPSMFFMLSTLHISHYCVLYSIEHMRTCRCSQVGPLCGRIQPWTPIYLHLPCQAQGSQEGRTRNCWIFPYSWRDTPPLPI